MNKRLQGFFAGILCTLILTSGTVFALKTTNLYNVVTNGIKIVLDGKVFTAYDATGKRVEPILYNGTTYLPVRAIGEAFGKEVSWDGANATVYVGDVKAPDVYIDNMTSIKDSAYRTYLALTDNQGNKYSRAIYNGKDSINLVYNTQSMYSRFKGTLYVPAGEEDLGGVTLKIVADGYTIYTSPVMYKDSKPVVVDVSLAGRNKVEVIFSNATNNYYIDLCLGDAGFYK